MWKFKSIKPSVLNTAQIIFDYTYLKPSRFVKELFTRKTLTGIIEQLYNPAQSDELKAASAAFGIFMGIVPIWGFQTVVAIFFAVILKLNKSLVVIFSQVSFPPLLPLIVVLSYRAGQLWTGSKTSLNTSRTTTSLQNINAHLAQYIYGSLSLAVFAGITIGVLTFAILRLIKTAKRYKLAVFGKKAL